MPKIVQKIAKPYISDDCIQIMIPFTNAMTILNEEGILFHQKNDSNLLYINKYIEDERRKQFPYSNIPFHNGKNGLNKMIYTNQLLEYEKPYIKISDGNLTENYVLKDQNNVFLIESKMETNKNTKCMTYEEFLKFISPQNTEEEQTFYVYIDGTIPLPDDPNSLFPFRDIKKAMSNFIQTKLVQNIADFREYEAEHNDLVSNYLTENPWFLNYLEASIKNLDLSLIDFNIGIFKDTTLLIIRIKNHNLTIQGIEATFVKNDTFLVDIYDIPVTKYTLEQLKCVSKIYITKEPRISLNLNPNLTRSDIKTAQEMVRILKK